MFGRLSNWSGTSNEPAYATAPASRTASAGAARGGRRPRGGERVGALPAAPSYGRRASSRARSSGGIVTSPSFRSGATVAPW